MTILHYLCSDLSVDGCFEPEEVVRSIFVPKDILLLFVIVFLHVMKKVSQKQSLSSR